MKITLKQGETLTTGALGPTLICASQDARAIWAAQWRAARLSRLLGKSIANEYRRIAPLDAVSRLMARDNRDPLLRSLVERKDYRDWNESRRTLN